MDCTLPGSSVYGIFQAIVLEWVPFKNCIKSGNSLVPQWLGLSAVTAVVWIQSLEDPTSCVAQQIKYFIKLKIQFQLRGKLFVGDGQGGLACCDSWGHKESDTAERLN